MEPLMVSSYSEEYSVGALDVSSFDVGVGDGKGGMGPRTTQITSHKVDCWTDGGDFV